MSDVLPYFLSPDFLFRNALLGGALVGVLCAVLGVYVVLRRLELLAVALPQASAAGIALSFWLSGHAHGTDAGGHGLALAGSLCGAFGCLLALAAVRRSPLPPESRVAALYALASAATVLFVASNPAGDIELTSLLRGDLLAIADRDLARLAAVGGVIALLFVAFRREILLASVDPELARTLGRDPARADGLLYALLGVAISLGVMCAGPLVVFGFLTLPALAALRSAPSFGIAFALAASIGLGASAGGFAVAYRLDLPAGPVEVVLAALPWLLVVGASALRRGHFGRAVGMLLLLVAIAPLACAQGGSAGERAASGPVRDAAEGPMGGAVEDAARVALEPAREGAGTATLDEPTPEPDARGTFPAVPPGHEVAVLPVRNDTGQALRLAATNPLDDLRRAAGDPFAPPSATVVETLTTLSGVELARRGIPVRAPEAVRRAFPAAPPSAAVAAASARTAGLPGPLLLSSLRRYDFGEAHVLRAWLDLVLVDASDGRVLWRGEARRPIPLAAARTQSEVLLDAVTPLFDEALGTR